MLLASCATGRSEIEPARVLGKPCPPLAKYTREEQLEALAEYETIKQTFANCVICRLMDDYALMREQCR